MSNPIANRLGLNSFWHHFWYSDRCYAMYLQQDALMHLLIETYLTYGSSVQTILFWNSYWFKTTRYTKSPLFLKYYRWATIQNKVFYTSTNYRFRLTGEHLMRARFSLLRFHSWIIFNFFWFQPNKSQKRRALIPKTHDLFQLAPVKTHKANCLIRLRSLLYYTSRVDQLSSFSYQF